MILTIDSLNKKLNVEWNPVVPVSTDIIQLHIQEKNKPWTKNILKFRVNWIGIPLLYDYALEGGTDKIKVDE